MPLKYESMPKITFCFTKNYLAEIRKIMFALQVFPVFWDTGFTLYAICFSQVTVLRHSEAKTKQNRQKDPEWWLNSHH
jgi:hypothetical protein